MRLWSAFLSEIMVFMSPEKRERIHGWLGDALVSLLWYITCSSGSRRHTHASDLGLQVLVLAHASLWLSVPYSDVTLVRREAILPCTPHFPTHSALTSATCPLLPKVFSPPPLLIFKWPPRLEEPGSVVSQGQPLLMPPRTTLPHPHPSRLLHLLAHLELPCVVQDYSCSFLTSRASVHPANSV